MIASDQPLPQIRFMIFCEKLLHPFYIALLSFNEAPTHSLGDHLAFNCTRSVAIHKLNITDPRQIKCQTTRSRDAFDWTVMQTVQAVLQVSTSSRPQRSHQIRNSLTLRSGDRSWANLDSRIPPRERVIDCRAARISC